MQRYFGDRTRCRVVLEASTHSPWVSQALAALGHEVIVANPAAMFKARWRRRRSDALDAELLARQGWADRRLLHPVTHRRPTAQQHLEILKARDQLVRTRTQLLINHVRSVAKGAVAGHRHSSAAAFVARAAAEIPAELRVAVQPVVQIITDLYREIRDADHEIRRLIRDVYPAA